MLQFLALALGWLCPRLMLWVDTGYRRGQDEFTYRNTGSYGSPTWLLMSNIQDEEIGPKRAKVKSSTRGFGGFGSNVPALIDLDFKWTMVADQSDPNLVAIQAAFYTSYQTGTEFAFSDGAIAGSGIRYIRSVCGIFDVSEPHPLEGLSVVNVEASPIYNANAPSVNTA